MSPAKCTTRTMNLEMMATPPSHVRIAVQSRVVNKALHTLYMEKLKTAQELSWTLPPMRRAVQREMEMVLAEGKGQGCRRPG